MNPRKRNLLKLKVRQAKVVTPVAPVVPVKRRTKKSAETPEVATEEETPPVDTEESAPKRAKRKRSWKL